MKDRVESLLLSHPEAGTAALARAALQRRYETKVVLAVSRLPDLLARVRQGYGLVRANGKAAAHYENLYLDTPAFDMYRDHLRGRRPRHKARIRAHVDRGCAFLEVKTKDNRGFTRKSRRVRTPGFLPLTAEERTFIDQRLPYAADELTSELWVRFDRLSLISRRGLERITFDFNIRGSLGPAVTEFDSLMVLEVKRGDRQVPELFRWIPELGSQASAWSKYCVATALLVDGIARHRFKPQLNLLERVTQAAHA